MAEMTNLLNSTSNPASPPKTSALAISASLPKVNRLATFCPLTATLTVPERSFTATKPSISASLIARYAVPSATFIRLAIPRTLTCLPISKPSI